MNLIPGWIIFITLVTMLSSKAITVPLQPIQSNFNQNEILSRETNTSHEIPGFDDLPLENREHSRSYPLDPSAGHPASNGESSPAAKANRLQRPDAQADIERLSLKLFSQPPLFIEPSCPTPMSLMLHANFGAARMQELADEIIRGRLHTTTYREMIETLIEGECPSSNRIIVSLDDLSSNYLRSEYKDMIAVFKDRGLVLVLGLIVEGPQDSTIWDYLRELETLGFEVASHSIHHVNLPEVDAETLEQEVSGSYRMICKNLGECPTTLILPFGNRDVAGKVMRSATQYAFVVGIAGGYRMAGSPPYYLGRMSPLIKDLPKTLRLLNTIYHS